MYVILPFVRPAVPAVRSTFFFSSRRRHTRLTCDWSSDVCSSDLGQEDKTKLGGGLGLHSPFGTFYVPNISPDPKDGIGSWNEQQFVTAMLKGTSPDRSEERRVGKECRSRWAAGH